MKTGTLIQLVIVILISIGCIYTLTNKEPHLGLDLSGGASLTYNYKFIEEEDQGLSEMEKATKVGQSVNTINNRLDSSGAEGVIVHTVAGERIEVQIPAVKGSTPEESMKKTKDKIADIKRKMDVPGQLSFWFEIDDENDKRPEIKEFDYSGRPVRLEPRFKDGVIFSEGRFDTHENKGWVVDIKFDGKATAAFFDLTSDAAKTGRKTAIILDGKVITMLSSSSPIAGGTCYIHGSFDLKSSTELATILQSGSMPIKLTLAQEYNVGPTLGKDSIEQSTKAVTIGSIIILLLMAIYYRMAGLIAIFALAINVALILVIMIYTNLVLTLPGIAGLLLTMGMAVDANILIYERIREELALGKSLVLSVFDGFDRAFLTIFDSNLTTVITGIVLFNVGTSALKGFATTLIIGLLISMFTSIFVSKVVFKVLMELGVIKNLKMMRIFGKTNFPFQSYAKLSFLFSGLIIVVGLGLLFSKGTDMLDVDFKGGISAMIKLKQPLEGEAVRSKMKESGYGDALIQNIEDNLLQSNNGMYQKYNLRFDAEHHKLSKAKDVNDKLNILTSDLIKIFDLDPVEGIVSINNVGPDVAHDLVEKAILAILASMIAILLYVRIRFSDFGFGIGACVALGHDVLISLACIGFWSLLPTGGRIDLNVVAALLTIVGFSINDTIVVFDRIRENSMIEKARLDASLKDPTIEYVPLAIEAVFDLAVNQTLTRTIWTSTTVFFATLALFVFGGTVIHGFAFTMLVGVVFGTYSSVFIAAPIVVYLHKKTAAKKKLRDDAIALQGESV
jgi:SecD/SecF fusion protein